LKQTTAAASANSTLSAAEDMQLSAVDHTLKTSPSPAKTATASAIRVVKGSLADFQAGRSVSLNMRINTFGRFWNTFGDHVFKKQRTKHCFKLIFKGS
jgi:hypothetical protein